MFHNLDQGNRIISARYELLNNNNNKKKKLNLLKVTAILLWMLWPFLGKKTWKSDKFYLTGLDRVSLQVCTGNACSINAGRSYSTRSVFARDARCSLSARAVTAQTRFNTRLRDASDQSSLRVGWWVLDSTERIGTCVQASPLTSEVTLRKPLKPRLSVPSCVSWEWHRLCGICRAAVKIKWDNL